jgi:hypothetical protein
VIVTAAASENAAAMFRLRCNMTILPVLPELIDAIDADFAPQ